MNDGLPWWAADFLRASRNGVEDRRRGRVTVVPGEAQALVEGRGFRPTAVAMAAAVMDERRWNAFFEVFAGPAIYPAALFAGYLPRSAKSALARAGVRLVPPPSRLVLGPDGCPPETVARGLQLIAEHFAADPFRLLLFRGADRQSVIAGIVRRWRAGGAGRPAIQLDELQEILDQSPDPSSDSLLPVVQRAEAFRDDPILRGNLARLYTKVSERAAAMSPRSTGRKERRPVLPAEASDRQSTRAGTPVSDRHRPA